LLTGTGLRHVDSYGRWSISSLQLRLSFHTRHGHTNGVTPPVRVYQSWWKLHTSRKGLLQLQPSYRVSCGVIAETQN
jgi:hypothetical protein